MSSALLAAIGLGLFALAYRFYSAYLATSVFTITDPIQTPGHELADGVDFVATPKNILFGHHFTSVAGAAPIVGPAIAVIWGWLPAFLWVVLGAIFIGAMHDFGCLVLSAKNKGRSIGDLTGDILSPRARTLFLSLVFFLAWLVIAVFAYVIATLFVQYPATVLPINFEILLALGLGWLRYKKGVPILWPSLIALALLIFLIDLGTRYPIVLPSLFGPGTTGQVNTWIAFLFVYCFVVSTLPVWVLLQPRDFINSQKLFLGLGAMYLGLFLAPPPMAVPALNLDVADGPSWFPFLFITIACGAVSGFHGLVSSGTTSKQLDKLSDARPIGYGSMMGEGSLALMSVLACTAGLSAVKDWGAHYHAWETANKLGPKISAFVEGGAHFLSSGLSISPDFAKAAIAVIVISFAATTLDTSARIQRYILSELGDAYGIGFLKNRFVGGAIASFSPILLVLGGQWTRLWPIFGATNQLLGGLSLIVLSVYLYLRKKNPLVTFLPMVFLVLMTSGSMAVSLREFAARGNFLLTGITGILLALGAWILWEGFAVWKKTREGNFEKEGGVIR